ncbi:Uncharacterised protein [Mycobacteroides abscessus subsp. abscessus]|nr:Uncharacterised protein [Mycobacteroides abscessus subsp. abscessus]
MTTSWSAATTDRSRTIRWSDRSTHLGGRTGPSSGLSRSTAGSVFPRAATAVGPTTSRTLMPQARG